VVCELPLFYWEPPTLFNALRQSAKSWELRAATSLAHLWQQQDKQKEAHNLLSDSGFRLDSVQK
jgi:hypothetical protein